MAPSVNFENEKIEYFLQLIVLKLAVLIAFSVLKCAFKSHSSYKRNLKKKYTAKDIEAPKPKPTTSAQS